LKARTGTDEGEEREVLLAAEIELDPSLRARLGVHELPCSIAERRHVGVVHVSGFIHNEGYEQKASSGRTAASEKRARADTEILIDLHGEEGERGAW